MVIENIFEHARKTPEKIAIYYGDHRATYCEFAFWISHVRHFLSQHHLRAGSIAVLCGVSALDAWVFGFSLRSLGLTTIQAPSLDALELIDLRNIGCAVTARRDLPIQVPAGCTIDSHFQIPEDYCLGKAAQGVPDFPTMTVPIGGHILVTSGTTGFKKKVLIDETRLAISLPRRADAFGISEHSVVNVFDLSPWVSMGYNNPLCAWIKGAAVVINRGPRRDRSWFVKGITHAMVTPPMLAELLKGPSDQLRRHEAMRLFVGGGALPRATAAAAKMLLTPHIHTVIGSTEVAVWTLTQIERFEDLKSHCIHPSVDVQVVDQADRLLPVGQIGLVRVSAVDGITAYLDDEEASRKFFRQGYFYPGDLGMFQLDGRLVLRGRVNNVINILGEKISAEPIELALQERLKTSGVCLIMLNEALDEQLHLVIEAPNPIGRAEVGAAINAELPLRLDDVVIHVISSLPRNDMGKIDRTAVRQLIDAVPRGSQE